MAQILPRQHRLHLHDILPFRLRHHRRHEDRPHPADQGEYPEGRPVPEHAHHVLEQLRDGERQEPVEGRRNRAGHALRPVREQLADHQPGDGTEADGEDDDEDGDRGDGDEGVVGEVGGVLQAEVDAEAGQADAHDGDGGDEEDLAAQAVDEERGGEGGQDL